jgi:hypothetical protein
MRFSSHLPKAESHCKLSGRWQEFEPTTSPLHQSALPLSYAAHKLVGCGGRSRTFNARRLLVQSKVGLPIFLLRNIALSVINDQTILPTEG